MRHPLPALLTALVVIATATAGVPVPVDAAASHDGDLTRRRAAPDDPASDRLGWEDGYWYNETLSVGMADGLNRSELDAVMARTMARVERIRRLEFKKTPPVTFLTRAEYADAINELFANQNITTDSRLHQNTKFEALFLVGEPTDYYRVYRQNQQGFAAAFYTPRGFEAANVSAGSIAIIRRSGGEVRLTETTLAHELVHALQDQHFNLTSLPRGETEDEARAIDGVVEGDATYVGSLYNDRCDGAWAGTCLSAPRSGAANFANLGLVFYGLVQYGNGMTFVQHVRQTGGWAAVNALYSDLPVSTEQIIHPERYPEDEPTNLTIEDRSNDRWHPLDIQGPIDHAEFGEAGLFTMLWYPSYLERGQTVIIPYNTAFVNRDVQPYDFAHPITAGWDGDRLLPFVTTDSAETNETGYVWKIAWDSPADARAFHDAYLSLLEYYGAKQVGDGTYRIDESGFGAGFGDAFHVTVEGSMVTIVNAPTVSALSGVRTSIDVSTPTPTPPATPPPMTTPSPTVTPTPTNTETGTEPGGTATSPPETTAPGQPGVGIVGAIFAVALALVLRRRR